MSFTRNFCNNKTGPQMAQDIRRLRNQTAALARFYRTWKSLGAEGCPRELENLMPLCDKVIGELDAEKPEETRATGGRR